MSLLILQTFIEHKHLQGAVGYHKDAEDLVLPKDTQLGELHRHVNKKTIYGKTGCVFQEVINTVVKEGIQEGSEAFPGKEHPQGS